MMQPSHHNDHKVPFVRITKRGAVTQREAWVVRVTALVLALLTCAILILLLGHNPIAVYSEMIDSAFGTRTGFNATIRLAIPLLGGALAIGLAFKMKFWNIGTEGQILIGGICATYFAVFHYQGMPPFVLLSIMGLAAITGGAVWGLIPAFFRAKWGTNETLFTLMLNYVAFGFVLYLQGGPWRRQGSDFPEIRMFDPVARLPRLFGIHIGWVLILILTVLVYLYLTRSKQGYQLTVVGQSENTARYAGMNVGWVIMRTMMISGAIAGFVGFMQVSGADFTLGETTAGGVGFTAITVAWLAQLNPIFMIIVSIFIATLQRGAIRIQTTFEIPATIATVLIGIILFFMLACEFFINYRLVFRNKKGVQTHG